MNKLILTDCDGVLLNWEFSFNRWMEENGYPLLIEGEYKVSKSFGITREEGKVLIKQFNESAAIGFLPPLRDAIHYVKKLHEEKGYIFRVITSLSLNPYAQRLREYNLKTLFGSAIDQVICLDTGADKDTALAPYKGSGLFWVEDKPENAELGVKLGLNSILMGHAHNIDNTNIPIAKNWKDIYERLL